MKRRLTRLSWLAIFFVSGSSAALLVLVFFAHKYPWPVFSSDFSSSKRTPFFLPWPMSPAEEDRQGKKVLRKLPKQEQLRRANLQLARMKMLNAPLFDVFLEPSIQFIGQEDTTTTNAELSFPWPAIETLRPLMSEKSNKKVSYIVVPGPHGTALLEGLFLASGEELRFNIPLSKNRRSLLFSAVPMTPGTVRVTMGQFSWSKTFSDADVNVKQLITIPINDSTATSIRVVSVTSPFLFMESTVIQRDQTGRLPIQLSENSPLWKPENREDTFDKITAVTPTPEATAVEVAKGDDSAIEAPPLQEKEDVTREGEQQNAAGGKPAPSPSSTPKETPVPVIVVPDPIEEVTNPLIKSRLGRTVALGYNTVFLQMEEIPKELLSNKDLMLKIAPNIQSFLENSLSKVGGFESTTASPDLFRETVLGKRAKSLERDSKDFSRFSLERFRDDNIYLKLRNYGYKILTIGTPNVYGFTDNLSYGSRFPDLRGRWLNENDFEFFRKNRELAELADPASGLNAVFQTKTLTLPPPLSTKDFSMVGNYLEEVAKNRRNPSDWGANELFFPDARDLYYPRTVEKFQQWTQENTQSRFFAHILLDPQKNKVYPTLKDFLAVLKYQKLDALKGNADTEVLAKLSHLDRAFGQILETIKFKRLEHRTIVALVIPNFDTRNPQNSGSFAIRIPGLRADVKSNLSNVSIDDLVASVFTHIGIPLGNNVQDSIAPFSGRSIELSPEAMTTNTATQQEFPAPSTTPPDKASALIKTKTIQYNIILIPGTSGCQTMEWRGQKPILGLTTSHPVVEILDNGKTLRFYPCSLNEKSVRISWFQELEESQNPEISMINASALSSFLGGAFATVRNSSLEAGQRDLPILAFGTKVHRLGSLPFSMPSLSKEMVQKLFDATTPLTQSDEARFVEKLKFIEENEPNRKSQRSSLLFWRSPPD